MTAPNIDMIVASLRSCSLGGSGGGGEGEAASPLPPLPYLAEETDESAGGVTVDLNSETAALPHHWEQCLDIRSGEIYYINWETGVRTTEDPRIAAAAAAYSSSYYYYYSDDDDDDDASSDEYGCASHIGSGDDDYGDDDDDGDTADSSSSLSSASPPHAVGGGGGGHVLVAAGCKSCFMYFMVPKRVDACPKCGGGLLHLGRNGCF